MKKKSVKDSALEYIRAGYSIIPVKADKKPLLSWEQFQKRRASLEEVEEWFQKWPDASIAMVTGSISDIVVIDVDDLSHEEIFDLLPKPLKCPSVSTPRGGLHLYLRAPATPLSNNAKVVPGCDFRGEGGYVLVPPSPGYQWLPGECIFDIAPIALPKEYISYINNNSFNNSFSLKERVDNSVDKILIQGRRDEDLFTLANALIKSGMPPQEARNYLMRFALSCDPPFPLKEAEIKIESALKRQDKRITPLAEDVRIYINQQEGYFSSKDLYNDLHISTKNDKQNIWIILKRLQVQGIIEKHGDRAGIYRRVEKDYEVMNIQNLDEAVVNLALPLRVHEWVQIMPKNIIIVAGQSNSGKTAFLLSIAERNMSNFKMRYLSSEMGPLELKSRLKEFKTPLSSWSLEFIERSTNFPDLVLSDGITIVDYLECSDEFYRIGGMIKDIYDKLTTGVAIIALQKNPGTDLGIGGARSLEKARLYLSMDHGVLKIVKAKNWRSITNPNGLSIRFKLVKGSEFIEDPEGWKRENG